MGLELLGGTLYINDEKLCEIDKSNHLYYTEEILPVKNKNFDISLSCELTCDSDIELDTSNEIFGFIPKKEKEFLIETDVPILIQKRWHKKKRINKKWLKRYGMKNDKIKIQMKTDAGTFACENETEKSIIGERNPIFEKSKNNLVNFEFQTNGIDFIMRPDQLIKHRKIVRL